MKTTKKRVQPTRSKSRAAAASEQEEQSGGVSLHPPALQFKNTTLTQVKQESAGAKEKSGESEMVRSAIQAGETSEIKLTNQVFYARHPDAKGKQLRPGSKLAREWISIRNRIVRPGLSKSSGKGNAEAHALDMMGDLLVPLSEQLKMILQSLDKEDLSKDQSKKDQAEEQLVDVVKTALEIEKDLRNRIPNYGKREIKKKGKVINDAFEGYGRGEDKYVCTTFAYKVLQEAGFDVSGDMKKDVNININWKKELGKGATAEEKRDRLKRLVRKGDERTKGIVYALTKSGQGEEVELENIQAGDFLQYWYKSGKGVGGHVVLVQEVLKRKGKRVDLKVHGSHGSTHGVASKTIHLLDKKGRLVKQKKKAYAVRPKLKS